MSFEQEVDSFFVRLEEAQRNSRLLSDTSLSNMCKAFRVELKVLGEGLVRRMSVERQILYSQANSADRHFAGVYDDSLKSLFSVLPNIRHALRYASNPESFRKEIADLASEISSIQESLISLEGLDGEEETPDLFPVECFYEDLFIEKVCTIMVYRGIRWDQLIKRVEGQTGIPIDAWRDARLEDSGGSSARPSIPIHTAYLWSQEDQDDWEEAHHILATKCLWRQKRIGLEREIGGRRFTKLVRTEQDVQTLNQRAMMQRQEVWKRSGTNVGVDVILKSNQVIRLHLFKKARFPVLFEGKPLCLTSFPLDRMYLRKDLERSAEQELLLEGLEKPLIMSGEQRAPDKIFQGPGKLKYTLIFRDERKLAREREVLLLMREKVERKRTPLARQLASALDWSGGRFTFLLWNAYDRPLESLKRELDVRERRLEEDIRTAGDREDSPPFKALLEEIRRPRRLKSVEMYQDLLRKDDALHAYEQWERTYMEYLQDQWQRDPMEYLLKVEDPRWFLPLLPDGHCYGTGGLFHVLKLNGKQVRGEVSVRGERSVVVKLKQTLTWVDGLILPGYFGETRRGQSFDFSESLFPGLRLGTGLLHLQIFECLSDDMAWKPSAEWKNFLSDEGDPVYIRPSGNKLKGFAFSGAREIFNSKDREALEAWLWEPDQKPRNLMRFYFYREGVNPSPPEVQREGQKFMWKKTYQKYKNGTLMCVDVSGQRAALKGFVLKQVPCKLLNVGETTHTILGPRTDTGASLTLVVPVRSSFEGERRLVPLYRVWRPDTGKMKKMDAWIKVQWLLFEEQDGLVDLLLQKEEMDDELRSKIEEWQAAQLRLPAKMSLSTLENILQGENKLMWERFLRGKIQEGLGKICKYHALMCRLRILLLECLQGGLDSDEAADRERWVREKHQLRTEIVKGQSLQRARVRFEISEQERLWLMGETSKRTFYASDFEELEKREILTQKEIHGQIIEWKMLRQAREAYLGRVHLKQAALEAEREREREREVPADKFDKPPGPDGKRKRLMGSISSD